MSQLALPLKLHDHAVFESFLPAKNETLVAFLIEIVNAASGPGVWFWGAKGTGKTHLLQAVCERAGSYAQYVPLRELVAAESAILDGLQSRQFVCIDDVDTVAGDEIWELALFSLSNMLTDSDGVMICTASAAPRKCGFALADLGSRFGKLPTFNLRALAESERIEALQLRAGYRGIELPMETANYLLTRSKRDMSSLYATLDKLDTEALKAKRRLTIPFVREILGISSSS